MKFRILVLSSDLERSRRLLSQFISHHNVRYEDYSHNDPYLDVRHLGKLKLRDGTLMIARSVSQGKDRFFGLRVDQVFTDLLDSEIPDDVRSFIECELTKSEIPRELQWTSLCPDYLLCYKCKCCTQDNECSELKKARSRRLSCK